MKYFITLVLLTAFCFGQDKPSAVPTPPKPDVVIQWFGTKPVPTKEDDQQIHAKETFEAAHEQDLASCENGPTDPESDPEVKRCDGVI